MQRSLVALQKMISDEYHKQKSLLVNPKGKILEDLYKKIAREHHGLYGDHFGCFNNFFSALGSLKTTTQIQQPPRPSIPLQGNLFANFA